MKRLKKPLKEVLQPFMERYGLTLRQTKTHWKVTHPATGQSVAISVSPSDRRAYENIRCDLRRLTEEKT